MQETLLRAWRSLDALAEDAAVRPWLLTIARREHARLHERKRLETVDLDALTIAEDPALGRSDDHETADIRAQSLACRTSTASRSCCRCCSDSRPRRSRDSSACRRAP